VLCECCQCALHVASGADLYGDLPASGVGDQIHEQDWVDLSELFSESSQDHGALFASLKEDKNAKALHELTLRDAELGRMTFPRKASECNLDNVRVCAFLPCQFLPHVLSVCR
jgi:hypothetical protein